MSRKFDFSGWATKNDLLCADGRIIRHDAFKDNDGQTVPLVYQHQHTDPTNILGHAILENRDDGVYAYCSFNDTDAAQHVKEAVRHGDVVSLSIYANKLVQKGNEVLHGVIREVSIVLAGANPGAYIDNPVLVHGEGTDNESYEDDLTEAVIYADSDISLYHAEPEEDEKKTKEAEASKEGNESKETKASGAAEKKEEEPEMAKENEGKTVQDVFDEFTEEQKNVVYYLIGQALEDQNNDADDDEDGDEDEDEGEKEMKHNVFDTDGDYLYGPVLSHSDEMEILANAKKYGSLNQACEDFCIDNGLQHDALAGASGFGSYPPVGGGAANVDQLFPDYHDVYPGAPEIVTNDHAWVKAVLGKVHKSPFSRIRTSSVDLRGIEEIRAKGYAKGKQKVLAGNYAVAKRATDPQTVYVRSSLNHDDIVDITDFDYVDYQYGIDRAQLEFELAQAILIGDNREDTDADKIMPDHIRNIWNDADIFTIHKVVSISGTPNGSNTAANFGSNYLYAQATEEALLDARIDFRGTGDCDMFCTQQFFNKLLLAKDLNGRRLYQNKGELTAALDVENMFPVAEMANKTRTVTVDGVEKTYRLLAIIGNLSAYALGATKGGEVIHRTQFDIDFNQEKSLLETRVSGATTKLYSFIVLEEEVTNP